MEELLKQAAVIRDETDESKNTAERVGTLFIDIIEKMGLIVPSESIDGDSLQFTADAKSVKLVFSALDGNGNRVNKELSVPVATLQKAGVMSPELLASMQKSVSDALGAVTTEQKDRGDADTKLRNDIDAINKKIGEPNGIAPLNKDGKVSSENLPESMGLGELETEAFPGNRGKNLEDVIGNIPSSLMLPGSLSTNISAADFLIEYQIKDKNTGKVESGRLVLPMVTIEKAGIMSAEDKAALDKLKNSGGGGSGSGFYDVTKQHPLENGFYTLTTAVAALETADVPDGKKPGLIITFEVSSGTWEDYRFSGTDISTFLTPASWERHGGGDAIKGVSVNGETLVPDGTGKVNLEIEQQETDATLDEESTNAIQNAPVAAKFKEIEGSSLFTSDVTENEDNTVTVALKNKSGENVTEFTIPAGKGGGGEVTGTTTKIALTSSVDNPIIKEGGSAVLSYS